MNASEWRSATESSLLLSYLEERKDVPDRKWRLFACASVRTIWDMIGEEICRQAVEVAELHADGRVSRRVAEQVKRSAELSAWPSQEGYVPHTAEYVASQAVITDAGRDCVSTARWVNGMVWQAIMAASPNDYFEKEHAHRSHQECVILRDLFSPFEPFPPLAPSLLTWSGGLIPRLAQAAYEERPPHGELDTARLAVLCDAVEEGGCTDRRLLAHLRSPGPHYRGCDALDAVLNRS
jgi:hypothetical protein